MPTKIKSTKSQKHKDKLKIIENSMSNLSLNEQDGMINSIATISDAKVVLKKLVREITLLKENS